MKAGPSRHPAYQSGTGAKKDTGARYLVHPAGEEDYAAEDLYHV